MVNTFIKIQTVTIGSGGAANIEFTSIPQTYTDLKIVLSARGTTGGGVDGKITFNSNTTGYSWRSLYGTGSGVASGNGANQATGWFVQPPSYTASVFSNTEIYIPNYTSSNNKSWSCEGTTETNDTQSFAGFFSGLWSNTAAITSISLATAAGVNLVQYSSATLYGIVNNGSYASGGDRIYTDGTYWYHQFLATGTSAFVPTRNLTVDYLVVAGGGGGSCGRINGDYGGGGGGAGGVRSTVGATGGGGALESPLSLTANTSYTVTVGAGGPGNASSSADNGTPGGNSVFSSITSTGGGGGGNQSRTGTSGGSGGGSGIQQTGSSGTANQGYGGGSSSNNTSGGGGGGGAGAVGATTSSGPGGNGGNGITTSISGTSTSYGGGGGAAPWGSGGTAGTGGLGGGGNGGSSGAGASATANTGGGGGGGQASNIGGAGGSGIVVIRYAV